MPNNPPIYCRVDDEAAAFVFDRDAAVGAVRAMRRKGYPAKCVPPVTVTY